MLESPTLQGTASICAGYDSCRASKTANKNASARTILETPHSAPFPGFTLENHPPRSQIRHADKVLNKRPHCCCQEPALPPRLQTSSTILRLCTRSLSRKQALNFIKFRVSGAQWEHSAQFGDIFRDSIRRTSKWK